MSDSEIRSLLNLLLDRLAAIESRLGKIEAAVKPSSGPAPEPSPAPPPAKPIPPPLPAVPEPPKPKPIPAPAPRPPKKPFSLENFLLGTWGIRIGVLMIFLASVFLLKMALDAVGEVGKVAIGVAIGLSFVIGGEITERKNYKPFARALTGGGLAILYLSFYGAFAFFKPPLIEQNPAFFLMALVTAAGVTLSVRYESQVTMIIAMLGGFATPALLSTGTDRQVALMSYMLVLDLGVLGVAYWRRWRPISLLGFTLTLMMFMGWYAEFYYRSGKPFTVTFLFATAFFALFAAASVLPLFGGKREARIEDLFLITLNALVYFFGMYGLLEESHLGDFRGLMAFSVALVYFLQVRAASVLTARDVRLRRFLIGLSLGALTLAIPFQLEYESVTLAWAIEGAALALYGLYSRDKYFSYAGFLVLIIGLVHLFGVDPDIYQRHIRGNHSTWKVVLPILVTYGSMLAAFSLLTWGLGQWKERLPQQGRVRAIVIAALAALSLIFLLVLNHYYFTSAESLDHIKRLTAHRYEVMLVSLILGLYAFAMIVLGIYFRRGWMRYYGLAVLAVTVLKVLLYDMSSLALGYRVVSGMVVGGLLILLSFLYQQYKGRIEALVGPGEPPKLETEKKEDGHEE